MATITSIYESFQITSLSFTPKIAFGGEPVTMNITIKNTSGVKITKIKMALMLQVGFSTGMPPRPMYESFDILGGSGYDETSFADYSWANGASKTFSYTFTLNSNIFKYRTLHMLSLTIYSLNKINDILVNNSFYRDDFSSINPGDVLFINKRYSPSIKADFYRAEIGDDGVVEADESTLIGMNVLLSTSEPYDDIFGSSEFAKLYYSESVEVNVDVDSPYLEFSKEEIAVLRSGVTGDVNILKDIVADLGNDHYFTIVYGDEYETTILSNVSVSQAFANVHLSGSPTGGVAFGKFSSAIEGNPLFECQYPAEFNAPATFNAGIQGVTNFPDLRSADGTITLPVSVEELTGGKWIDGKPIYRFVWMGTSTHYDSQKIVAYFPDKTPPDTVIRIGGTWRRDYDDKTWFSIPNIYYGSIEWAVNMRTTTDGGIILGFGDKYSGKKTIILMVEYTKTTD